jgi:3-deoxy-D-manno-octulosonic-acid transferase
MTIWLHGASVGEVLLAMILIKELAVILPGADFVLSTMTEQGMEVARKQEGVKVRCIYAPLDLVGIVGRAIRKIKPSLYICLETELWPAFLLEAKRSGVKLVLLNGRLSELSYQRYKLVKGFMKRILSCFSMISVIQQTDAKRYISLGAEPGKIRVLGNAKYDQAEKNLAPESQEHYRSWLNLHQEQPLFVAGSTHTGEEEMLLAVFQDLKKATGLQDLVWIVAPRHLQRLAEVEEMLNQKQVPYERLSDLKSSERKTDTILVDSMGDLAGFYSIASYVFCGGSLVERGGHNIMEAAIFGKPVFYGPSMKDFSDAAELLESGGGGFPVGGPEALTESILYFMDHPEEYDLAGKRAREVAATQQGAARKQAQLIKDVLKH